MQKKQRIWVVFGITAIVITLLVGVCFLIQQGVLQVPCLFRTVTGLLCPGCGNTGAAMALLRGDIAKAFWRNPFCFLEFAYIGWVLAHMTVSYIRNGRFSYRSPCPAVDVAVLVAIVLWGALRNFL